MPKSKFMFGRKRNLSLANFYLVLVFLTAIYSCDDDVALVEPEDPFENVWVDPAFHGNFEDEDIVVWFTEQFLPHPESYSLLQAQYSGIPRPEVRNLVVSDLKELSNSSFNQVSQQLDSLIDLSQIQEVNQHWIINGFSCKVVGEDGMKAIAKLKGVTRIYRKLFEDPGPDFSLGPEFIETPNTTFIDFNQPAVWNLKKLNVPDVLNQLGYTGMGVKNIIHDFGIKLDVIDIESNIYKNPGEVPGNGIDDDNNGYVDDFHGYNFDKESSLISNDGFLFPGFNHGSSVAAFICGRTSSDTIVGVAPESTWAAVRGVKNFEEMLEWSISMGFDTYSMSFSIPNLNEFRDHYRKIFEHAAYCGLFFVSGAGNFANPNNQNFAPTPIQMRFPEDIPDVVFGVAGVDSTFNRPVFSSQGPVEWSNDYYSEGRVRKPDFATFNAGLFFTDIDENILKSPVQGNSFAGPQLTGVIALILSANPDLMPWDVRSILIQSSTDILSPGFDSQSGYGLINAFEAVKLAESY